MSSEYRISRAALEAEARGKGGLAEAINQP